MNKMSLFTNNNVESMNSMNLNLNLNVQKRYFARYKIPKLMHPEFKLPTKIHSEKKTKPI